MTQFLLKGFEFIDFEPTTSLTKGAIEGLSRVFGESPSDSSAQASLKKNGNLFEGHMSIRSAVGNFVADVIGEDPTQVINGLLSRVRTQLVDWKRGRLFESSSI